jgi:hypothetical protein
MAQMPLATRSCNEERLALVLQAAQTTDDLLHAEVVTPTDARGEDIESRFRPPYAPTTFWAASSA